jgi:hypothetical protein
MKQLTELDRNTDPAYDRVVSLSEYFGDVIV